MPAARNKIPSQRGASKTRRPAASPGSPRGTVTRGWSYRGFEVVVFENEKLRLTILPEIGAKIHQMIDKRIDRDLLFHHPRVELRPPVFGANVDNWWTGGIDDVIPTGHPCVVNGDELPFLGEVWSLGWQWEQLSPNSVKFSRQGVITPFRLERIMTLKPGESFVTLDYTLTNIGTKSFPYLWGIHPAVPVGKSTRIDVPAREAWRADGNLPEGVSENYAAGKTAEPWPIAALAKLAAEPRNTWYYFYLSKLKSGWLAISDPTENWGFAMTYPREVFPEVHVWLVDGGWRGLRCAVVEPWSGRPARLDQAMAAGHARTLEPGAQATAQVRLIAFTPKGPVRGFDPKGNLQ